MAFIVPLFETVFARRATYPESLASMVPMLMTLAELSPLKL